MAMLDAPFACLLAGIVLISAPLIVTFLAKGTRIPSVLVFSFSLLLQQLLFALAAALFGSYSVSFPIAVCLVLVIGYLTRSLLECRKQSAADNDRYACWSQRLPWLVFFTVLIIYTAIRAQYSYINFNNNGDEAGVEKLFNLSLQQSFLFGESYPPEWIWLAGEPIRYYIFLKSIPGLAAWLARVLFQNAATGGIFFIVSGAFFAALTPAIICAWTLWFGRQAIHQSVVRIVSVLLALFCFLSAHYQAVSLGIKHLFSGLPLDWWSLSHEVIPYTDNQYSIWFMILGDNHAYMQVHFLQALIWGFFLNLVLLNRIALLQAAGMGVLFACLVLSHPGSVLVDVSVMSVFICVYTCQLLYHKKWGELLMQAVHGIVAIFVALFFLLHLYQFGANVKFVFPGSELASQLPAFLNLNFSIIIWLALLLLHPVIFARVSVAIKKLRLLDEWLPIIAIIITVLFWLANLPALAFMTITAYVTCLAFGQLPLSREESILTIFAACSFVIWFLPEVFAFDHAIDSRTLWIRFQMSLRFWPEGYILIPFALTVAVIGRIGSVKVVRLWSFAAASIVVVFAVSHIPGIQNRIQRTPHPFSIASKVTLDGFDEFSRRYPSDGALVAYLRTIEPEQKITIAESCGIGDAQVPVDFAWPGRIAAFSGRSGICGWTRHAILYNNPLQQRGFKGVSVEERSASFLKAYLGFFANLLNGDLTQAKGSVLALKALGVSHIVFGEFERRLFPNFVVGDVADNLPVKVLFKTANGMGIYKIVE
jgi:hypothetical protein